MLIHGFYLFNKGEIIYMKNNELLDNIIKTLEKLYICKNSSGDVVKSDVNDAILYFNRFLIEIGYDKKYQLSNVVVDKNTLYYILISVFDDMKYYDSLFINENLIGAWFSIQSALDELEVNNISLNNYAKKRVKDNKVIE